MMAWMNRDAVTATRGTGKARCWARSRSQLWCNGKASRQEQALKDFRWDCDNDTVLVLVDQTGEACHTGRRNCFFNAIRDDKVTIIAEVQTSPEELYKK